MKKVYNARDPVEAELINGFLANNDIIGAVQGGQLWGLRGALPMTSDTEPSIWVHERDFKKATLLINEWAQGKVAPVAAEDNFKAEILVDSEFLTGRAFLTVAICAICLLIFTQYSGSKNWKALESVGFFPAYQIWSGKYWALLTPPFLHVDVPSLVFCVFWFFFFGRVVELRFGRPMFLQILLLSALFTEGSSLLVHENCTPSLLGIILTFGTFLWVLRARITRIMNNGGVAVLFFISLFCVLLASRTFAAQIANVSHIAGPLTGISLGFILVRKERQIFAYSSLLILAICVFCSLFWMPWSASWLAYKSNSSLKTGDVTSAIQFGIQAVMRGPENAEANSAVGNAYLSSYQLDKAMTAFQQVEALEGKSFSGYYGQGQVLLMRHEYAKAIDMFGKALARQLDNAHGYSSRAWSFYHLSMLEEAKADFSYAVSLKPDDPYGYVGLGATLNETYNPKEAQINLTKAIGLLSDEISKKNKPNFFQYAARGDGYFFLGEYSKALDDYLNARTLRPNSPGMSSMLGWAELKRSSFGKALDYFKDTYNVDRRDDYALLGQGIANLNLGKLDEALKSFNEALDLNPRRATIYLNRGILFAKKGETKKAIEDFSKTIELNARNAEAFFWRAKMKAKLKDLAGFEMDRKSAARIDAAFDGRSYTD